MFKKKMKYEELLKLITQIGYERFYTVNEDLKQQFSYNEVYFYLVFQIINCFIFQRMLKYQKLISQNTDVFKDISTFIINYIQSTYKDDLTLAYIQIKDEILDIWKNDDDTNSNNELNKTANYLVNKILECEDNEHIDLKFFFTDIITRFHFENKKIVNNFKLIN